MELFFHPLIAFSNKKMQLSIYYLFNLNIRFKKQPIKNNLFYSHRKNKINIIIFLNLFAKYSCKKTYLVGNEYE